MVPGIQIRYLGQSPASLAFVVHSAYFLQKTRDTETWTRWVFGLSPQSSSDALRSVRYSGQHCAPTQVLMLVIKKNPKLCLWCHRGNSFQFPLHLTHLLPLEKKRGWSQNIEEGEETGGAVEAGVGGELSPLMSAAPLKNSFIVPMPRLPFQMVWGAGRRMSLPDVRAAIKSLLTLRKWEGNKEPVII